jgi:hypothetical protein
VAAAPYGTVGLVCLCFRSWLPGVLAVLAIGCVGSSWTAPPSLDAAAERYVRIVLALAERDGDSLDSYHGPASWQADARALYAPLASIRAGALALAESVAAMPPADSDDAQLRRAFLDRQLRAIVARIDILRGSRPKFDDEVRALFDLDLTPNGADDADAIRGEIARLLPGEGALFDRYAAFDRGFLVPSDRREAVVSRAIEACRAATRGHLTLPASEKVIVEYAADLPWSAFTRYEGRGVSRVRVNAALPLTVDRALDLACHETYPGHHTIDSMLDARSTGRVELLVRPLFSPQTMLHEAAASLAPSLAFPEPARVAVERDVLFPLAAIDPAGAERHVRVSRLVDRLSEAQAATARQYVDGALDYPRAAAALQQGALMPAPDSVLKFLNQFRSYAATYTLGRERLRRHLDAVAAEGDKNVRWRAFIDAALSPAQILPPEPRRRQ